MVIMNPIRTYVFMDMETTGIPREENNTTKMTELSMIAVKREHFLDTAKGKSPRVQNKLTLCFNPGKLIHPDGTKVTGLCNFLLEYEMKFNRSSFEIIDAFLSLLTQPVCLIAQNGNNFDYPILKNNMERLNVDFSCDVKIADSFFAFYHILENVKNYVGPQNGMLQSTSIKVKNYESESSLSRKVKVKRSLEKDFSSDLNLIQKIGNNATKKVDILNKEVVGVAANKSAKLAEGINMKINSNNSHKDYINGQLHLPSNNIEYTQKVNKTNTNNLENTTKTISSTDTCDAAITVHNIKGFIDNEIIELLSSDSEDTKIINESKSKQKASVMHKINGNNLQDSIENNGLENTSDAAITLNTQKEFVHNDFIDLFSNDSTNIQKINECTPKKKVIPYVPITSSRKAKRSFPWNKDSKPNVSYKLGDIYKRQLNRQPPEAHRAENDCLMAMEIAVTVGKDFVEWVDKNHTDFKDVVPMTIGVKI